MSEDKAYKLACRLFNDYNYNGSQWEIDTQIDSYYNCLKSREAETGKEYDYDKMYRLIEKEYKYKTVPAKNLILDWHKRCIKHNYDTSRDGELILFLCYNSGTDGHYEFKEIREYTVCNSDETKISENEILYKLKKLYDEVSVKRYKAGSNVMGSAKQGYTVFIPIKYDEMGEVTEYESEKVA